MSGKTKPSLCKSILKELNTYRLSETKKDCIKDLCELHIPKKPNKETFPINSMLYNCPSCCAMVCDKRIEYTDRQYCEKCGQALDWE